MASPNDNNDFKHQVAIKLSRALNTINPNDLLAERVMDIAKSNTVENFMNGVFRSSYSFFVLHALYSC